MSRAEKGLPTSPNKRKEIIGTLAKKYQMRIVLKEKRGRKHRDLNEDQEHWLVEFLERSDISYINPGKKDHVYVGKVGGISQYVQKQYLLWTLRDLLDIINGNAMAVRANENFESVFLEKMSFGQLYQFVKSHKQYIFNRDIPHSSCLCEVCENACLLAKGINKSLGVTLPTNPHELVERYSCDSSNACMNSAIVSIVFP